DGSRGRRLGVRVGYLPWAYPRPIAMPATGALIGTPASISERVEPQTEAIDVDPFDASTSETTRNVYGHSCASGTTGTNARSASAPWPISRRFGEPTRPVSPVENGGELE